MRRWFAIDTGSTRNASGLVGAEESNRIWTLFLVAKWQGTPDEPLDHRNVVGPEMARLVLAAGGTSWMADAFEEGPIRLVCRDFGITCRFQGPTELAKVYKHGQAVVHQKRLRLARTPIAGHTVDLDLWAEISKGLAAIQEERRPEGPKVWLPSDGKNHHDLASAFLRMMFDARAGDDPAASPDTYAEANRKIVSERVEMYGREYSSPSGEKMWQNPRHR